MQANKFGSWAEQKRHKAGWTTKKENPTKKLECKKCDFFKEQSSMGKNYCERIDAQTQKTAICKSNMFNGRRLAID